MHYHTFFDKTSQEECRFIFCYKIPILRQKDNDLGRDESKYSLK